MTAVIFSLIMLLQGPVDTTFELALEGFVRTTEVYPDSALYYAQGMLQAAHKSEDDLQIVRAEYALGYTYRYLDNYVESIRHYRISFQLARSSGFVERELMATNGLGMALYQVGDYPQSLRYLFLSLDQRRTRGDAGELSTIYNNIGLVYLKLYNWEKAYEFFVQALMIQEEVSISDGPVLVNLGLCLTQLGRFEEATIRFTQFRDLCEGSTDCSEDLWCDFYNALGGMYHNQEQLESAEIYFEKAYEIAAERDLDAQKEKALDNIATLAREQGAYSRAAIISDSALQIAKRLGSTARIENNYHHLALIHQEGGALAESVMYWSKYDSMNQQAISMLNEIYTVAMNEQEQSFDARILDQNAVLQVARRNTYILSAFLIIMLTISFFWWKNVQRKKDAIKELSEMREIFVRRQKMAALGSLMAGIAHEIHTPLGAAQASLEASEGIFPRLWSEYSPGSADKMNFASLYQMQGESSVMFFGRKRREVRMKLAAQIEQHGIHESRKWSELLTDIGVTEVNRAILPYLESQEGNRMLDQLHRVVQVERNNHQARKSVEQIQKVIQTFRDQALDQATSALGRFNVEENLRGAMLLVKNQLKDGVEMEMDFPEHATFIEGNAAQLSQVWTNLLVNALQAMTVKNKRLHIRVCSRIPGIVQIAFVDTGHGITVRDQPHVFQNFFTTRHNDQGMGLGLHLSKQIIEDHGGRITFVSGMQFTEMHVFLPRA